MKATKFYTKYSKAQLSAMMTDEKYTKHQTEIAWAITWHLADERAAAGNPVPTNGYSGRNSKRR